MKKGRTTLIFLILCFYTFTELVAQDRYAIYFKYKPQEDFSLARPQEFLSSRSLTRRTRESFQADSLDLPVASKYIAAVSQKVDQILYDTKWFNAVLVVASAQNIEEIENLPFVSKVELVAVGFLQKTNARLEITGGKKNTGNKFGNKFGHSETRQTANQEAYTYQNELIGIPEMHAAGFRGKGVMIAVFDAGFPGASTASSLLHLQVNKQIAGAKDFVRPWNQDIYTGHEHGTNVLSLMGSDEPAKMIGGAPDASFVLVITEDVSSEYRVEEFNWVRGAEYADSLGVDIINSSLGYLDFDDMTMNYAFESLDGKTALVSRGAVLAAQRGILVVNSVGNYGPNVSSLVAPADATGILSIGSVNKDLKVSSFSSRGPTRDLRIKPDLVAMGNGTTLIRSTGLVGTSSGTSFSAPQVAALAAGLWGANPNWKKDELIQNLLNSGSKADNQDNQMGFGLPSFALAHYGEALSVLVQEEPRPWRMFPNPLVGQYLYVEFEMGLEIRFSLIDLSGKYLREGLLKRNSIYEPYQADLKGVGHGLYVVQLDDGTKLFRSKIYIK